MKVAIGFDHAGFPVKEVVMAAVKEAGHEFYDQGTENDQSCDYPDFAFKVAKKVSSGECQLGILVCGTGIGMSMAANKVNGVRAAVAASEFMAKAAREHNDANVLCLGQRVSSEDEIRDMIKTFLAADFEGGRHQRRVDKITRIQKVTGC